MYLSTFSISARCARSGMLGVAVSTAVPGVGGICPFVRPGVGAVSTQAWVNPYLGLDAVELLARGRSAEQAVREAIDADPGRAVRQLGAVDARGRSSAWTGEECVDWAGQKTGPDVSIQGNMLVGPATLEAMFESFAATGDEDLPERLVKVLEAGQAAGGPGRVPQGTLPPHRYEGGRAPRAGARAAPGLRGRETTVPAVRGRDADPGKPAGRARRRCGRDAHARPGRPPRRHPLQRLKPVPHRQRRSSRHDFGGMDSPARGR